jgi:hypothetical protein
MATEKRPMRNDPRKHVRDVDYIGARSRIRAALQEEGPLTTVELIHRLKHAFPENVIRKAANYLGDDREIVRVGATKPWNLIDA